MKLNYYLSLAALIPAAILFVRIYPLDHIEKEPRRLLGKIVLFGARAAVPAALAQLLKDNGLAAYGTHFGALPKTVSGKIRRVDIRGKAS